MCPADWSAAVNYMSLPGFVRLMVHDMYGVWISMAHAVAIVVQNCGM